MTTTNESTQTEPEISIVEQPTTPTQPKARGRAMVIWGASLLALSVLVGVSLVGFGGFRFARFATALSSMNVANVPGTNTVRLEQGGQIIWIEGYDGASVNASEVRIRITNIRTGQNIPVFVPNRASKVTLGRRKLNLFGRATAPETGDYRIETESNRRGLSLGFTRVDLGTWVVAVGAIFAGIGIGTVLGILGLVLLIIGLVKRSKAKKAALTQ